jgi:hypothetical protein
MKVTKGDVLPKEKNPFDSNYPLRIHSTGKWGRMVSYTIDDKRSVVNVFRFLSKEDEEKI